MKINYNINTILSNLDEHFDREDIRKQLKTGAAERIMRNPERLEPGANPVVEAADEFTKVMKQEIATSPELTDNAKSSISSLSYGRLRYNGNGVYSIGVWFNDVSRSSLYPGKYPNGVDNIANLFNYGVGHEMSPVYGWWHSNYIKSKTQFPALNFYERAISKFVASNPQHILAVHNMTSP